MSEAYVILLSYIDNVVYMAFHEVVNIAPVSKQLDKLFTNDGFPFQRVTACMKFRFYSMTRNAIAFAGFVMINVCTELLIRYKADIVMVSFRSEYVSK